ncbi:LysR family transcriptional regulator, partial [Acinetobacter baumannii]|nr:LysR family transcriptional regulator [Acinetobacter baumannii]
MTIIRTTMLNLQRVTMFIAVVDAGSFTLAAAAL